MNSPARTLARGAKLTNWLSIALAASVLLNIATPLYYSFHDRLKEKLVVFDLASGSLLLSPLSDPSDSRDILEISSSWAAKAILDRNPAGLDNDPLVNLLFNTETGRKIRDEFGVEKIQYEQKNLRSHIEIKTIDAQAIGKGLIKSKVSGQLITTGIVHGTATQEVHPVALELSLARNPDLGRNRRYPLMCYGYVYTQGGGAPLAKQ
jgi:hypothetical protein